MDGFAIFSNSYGILLDKNKIGKRWFIRASQILLLIVLILMNQSMYGDEMIKLRMEPADESILFR